MTTRLLASSYGDLLRMHLQSHKSGILAHPQCKGYDYGNVFICLLIYLFWLPVSLTNAPDTKADLCYGPTVEVITHAI